ncbi:predicted protein [Naegleria gruberi]|uniref:Predicted protein n=1 Tax=Naegleria gruberi TaxID=5762 RepID=D2W4H6_NAEGR|nr:uncharacterized protein NAEGRDRAFT_76310 [Naegleria gruberi]EFC36020.1 predicted protein [Naegleria gruberi]|eukprot:XP_002668764.1 predicted protein [Naegleria gruberi strain NEG-M]
MSARGANHNLSILLLCILLVVVLLISYSIDNVEGAVKKKKKSNKAAETVLIVVKKNNQFPELEVRELKKGRKKQSDPIQASSNNYNHQGKAQNIQQQQGEAETLTEGEVLAEQANTAAQPQQPTSSLPNKTIATKAQLEANTKTMIIIFSIVGCIILGLALIGIIAGVAFVVKQKRNYPSSSGAAASSNCCSKLKNLLCCCCARRATSHSKKHDDYENGSSGGSILYRQDDDMKRQLLDKLQDYEL